MYKKNKKVFITGGTGLLGSYLVGSVPEGVDASYSFFPADKKDAIINNCGKYHLDTRDKEAVFGIMETIKPDYIIHAASLASVDYVEKNKEEAKAVNLGGTSNIIDACKKVAARLLYISSNAVFDGTSPPYAEEDRANPISYYGNLKLQEESLIKESGLDHSIVRAILMYGWNLPVERKNPVTWLIDMLKGDKSTNMVDDIFCNPLFAGDCADIIWKIIAMDKKGIYHAGGRDEISRYEFACITAEIFGFNKGRIRPVDSSFFPAIAPRPRNTTYKIDKIKRELGISPLGVREGLIRMKEAKQ